MFSLIEQLSQELLSSQVTLATNSSSSITTAPSIATFSDVAKFIASFSIARDWVKLFLLGSVLETLRRFTSSTWSILLDSFFLTATFESDDDAYNWMMVWVARQPMWNKARDIQISTKEWGIDFHDYSARSIHVPGEADEGLEKRSLRFLPSFGLTQTLWYHGYWMRATRTRRALQDGDNVEILTLRILTRSQDVLNRLLLDAKLLYEKEEQNRVSIYTAGSYNDWRRTGSRPKRPMESIVLDPGLKEMVIQDAREFMHSEKWYSERGLPYRRGYLFHGCPGSGKTSLVHAIAGELNLDIYVINLSKRGLDDSGLTELISDLPARSVALIEEIDAAFLRGVSRDAPGTGSKGDSTDQPTGGVTLSGLLASIDGIQASEGRLLFATTNNYHALDVALIRAGRLDVHVEFAYASQIQAEELFKRFFHANDDPAGAREVKNKEKNTPIQGLSHYTPMKPEILTSSERDALAKRFAEAIPEHEFAVASIQGLLLNFKNQPSQVITEVPGWVEKERTARREREQALAIAGGGKGPASAVDSGADESKQEPRTPPSESLESESAVLV